ncbi:MAG TPA: hypothetical protein VFC21_07360 [Bryobacteraceae bacterium]|nr:hypothetical protein [Bryobacteraceae bacterium]
MNTVRGTPMRGVTIIFAGLLVAAGVYAVPNLMELTLLNSRMNPWITCVFLGDIFGCGILFLLGFRKAALLIYAISTVTEGLLLRTHHVAPQSLVWFTNLAPAVVVGAVVMKAGLRALVAEE